MNPQTVKEFYFKVIGCPCIEECALHGALTLKNSDYHTPRWFFGDYSKHKDVLVIATNPGVLDDEYESDYGKILSDFKEGRINERIRNERLFAKQFELAKNYFEQTTDPFHGPLMETLRGIFNVTAKNNAEVFYRYTNFTNIVKCSTCCNFSGLWSRFKKYLVDKCLHNYLQEELVLLQPKILRLYVDKGSQKKDF